MEIASVTPNAGLALLEWWWFVRVSIKNQYQYKGPSLAFQNNNCVNTTGIWTSWIMGIAT